MDFGLSKEISKDVLGKSDIITEMSLAMADYLKDKDYGKDVLSFYIGIMCVAPEFEFFFKELRKKYTKSKKMLEYDIKLDHSTLKKMNDQEVKELLAREILQSLCIVDKFGIKDFKKDLFKTNLESFFYEKMRLKI